MTNSLAISFGSFNVTTPMPKLYNVVGDLLDVSTRRSPLYFVNHFQYRHGNLFRAALGKLSIWDKDYEDRLASQLDKSYHRLMQAGYYDLSCMQSLVAWPINIKGLKWVNGVPPKALAYHLPKGLLKIDPGTSIYVRTFGDRVDIEGLEKETGKEMVISTWIERWNRVKQWFKVKDERRKTNI